MKVLVKICGLTTPEDAEMVAAAGADAIGVNLWPGSKRFAGEAAASVLAAVPDGVLKVGVFVNATLAEVRRALVELRLDRVQLHGDEQAGDFRDLDPARLIRAVRVRDLGSFADDDASGWQAPLRLYDAFSPGFGGAGVVAPWELIARHGRRPFLLAGGLDPDNVSAAIAAVAPAGVDVASGVESRPGRKDRGKVRDLIAAARASSGV